MSGSVQPPRRSITAARSIPQILGTPERRRKNRLATKQQRTLSNILSHIQTILSFSQIIGDKKNNTMQDRKKPLTVKCLDRSDLNITEIRILSQWAIADEEIVVQLLHAIEQGKNIFRPQRERVVFGIDAR